MLEVTARNSDPRVGPGAENGSSLPFQEFLTNFRSGIWQNGQRIWIQHAKTLENGYLVVFFGVRMRENGEPKFLGCWRVHGGAVDRGATCRHPIGPVLGWWSTEQLQRRVVGPGWARRRAHMGTQRVPA